MHEAEIEVGAKLLRRENRREEDGVAEEARHADDEKGDARGGLDGRESQNNFFLDRPMAGKREQT